MKKKLLIIFAGLLSLGLSSCDQVINREPRENPTDPNFWRNESDVRLFGNGFYSNYFIGYGVGWSAAYSDYRGYVFSDDVCSQGTQASFEDQVPTDRGSKDEALSWMTQYCGPTWNFTWVHKANIFINRLNKMNASGLLTTEAFNHWMSVAKFYKCFAYARLVEVFGDVPYFAYDVPSTDTTELYKDRDSRLLVMDSLYTMSKYTLENMRVNDGADLLNRYVAAGFISRWFLFEGTWQIYHNGDPAHAKKYLELARDAAAMVMKSGNYAIDTPLREVFGSQNLAGNKECLMYQHFDDALGVRHCVASYSNSGESQTGVNLAFLKSVICTDGRPYKTSKVAGADNLGIKNMTRTRDPRFEASFIDTVNPSSSTMVYQDKFIDRAAIAMTSAERAKHPEYNSSTNTNDAPVIRYAEVLLNWIEAKAELARMGEEAVTQADIDASINVLRDRPLDATAQAKHLTKTAHMQLSEINGSFDPDRDPTVDPLIWEIRRERRLEMVFEHSRLLDLKRWKKLDYMDNDKYPDTMLGCWIDFNNEYTTYLKKGSTQVKKADGTVVTYDGSNAADMVGFFVPLKVAKRNPFLDRVYMSPVGHQQITAYKQRGHTLTQTVGW